MPSCKTRLGRICASRAYFYEMEKPLKVWKFKDNHVVIDAFEKHDTQALIFMISWKVIKRDPIAFFEFGFGHFV